MHIDFETGMTVLTGETGAGKSIIVDALGQLCGQRSSVSLIKKDASKAVIEGIFDIDINPDLENICEQLHIDLDEQLVITKEILNSGKSTIKINYQNASNSALKLLMPHIIDIHSQFETQKLFEEKKHIYLLDQFDSNSLNQWLNQYLVLFHQYNDVTRQLKKMIENEMSDEQLEFLESQLNEIDEVAYTDDEVEEFENELKIMQNIEKVNEGIQQFEQEMNSSNSVLTLLKDALFSLKTIMDYGNFQKSYENIYNIYYNLIDEYETVMDIYHQFQFDEYRYQELQDILFQVNRLKRKYGFTMERIFEYREEISDKINQIHHREEIIQQLEFQKEQTRQEALSLAKRIHEQRVKNAYQFEKRIQKELQSLYMDKAVFKIQFEETDLNDLGIDKIKFMISTNKGQQLSLLNETASGGEISRIMFAIKTVILSYENIDTIIFDEVDTGVSGKIASRIGEKMLDLSNHKQVICITHLPQVACLANHHFVIQKKDQVDQTIASIELLNNENRVIEIAKMLSGEKITPEAINNAKQLLNV